MPYPLGWGSPPTPLQHPPPLVLIWTKIFELCCGTKRNKSSQQVGRHGGDLIFGLVAGVVLFLERFIKPRLFMWHLFLPDLEENGVYEKLLFNLHLICVYWHIYCGSKQTLPSSACGCGSFYLLDSLSPTKAFFFFFALIPVLPLEEQAAVGETSSNMSHLAPKQVGEEKHHFKPKFDIRMNFCQINLCLLRKIKDHSRTCRRYSQSRKDKGSVN